MATKIGFIVGSLRKDSYNKKVAKEVEGMFPEDFEITWLKIDDLDLYNEDLEGAGKTPESWKRFREEAGKMDGFVFFSPEYNRSMSAATKNAIDVGSRGRTPVWKGKFAGIITSTHGAAGGMMSNHALRQTFTFNDLTALAWPEVYLGGVEGYFEGDKLKQGTYDFVKGYIDKLVEFSTFFTKNK